MPAITSDVILFDAALTQGGRPALDAKRRLEDRLLHLTNLADSVLAAYERYRRAVESRTERFNLSTRDDYYAQVAACLDLWKQLNAAVGACEKAVPSRVIHATDSWHTLSYRLESAIQDDWVPAARVSDFYDDAELTEENSEYLREFESRSPVSG